MLFKKKMRVIIKNIKKILIKDNQINKKMKTKTMMSLISEELKWISLRKEPEKF
jgi:hypothetical protein